MIYRNAHEEWIVLSAAEQAALREACLYPWVSLGFTVDKVLVTPDVLESLCDKDFLEQEVNGSCYATEDGRAVFEAGNPQAAAGAAGVTTGIEKLLGIAKLAQFYAPGELGEFPDMMAKDIQAGENALAIAQAATDELATLRALLAEAQAANARLTTENARLEATIASDKANHDKMVQVAGTLLRWLGNANATLQATRDHIETFRNKVEMPPTVYVALTDMTLRIDEALDSHKQERAADAGSEGG